MRRSLITACVAILLAATMAPRAGAEAYAGFRAGVNMASFPNEGQFAPFGAVSPSSPYPRSLFPAMEYSGTRTGFTGAAFIGFDRGRYGFRTELAYTMKGATSGDASVKLDYLEVTPLFTFKHSLSSRFDVRLFTGPVVGLFVNAEADNGPVDVDLGDIVEHVEVSGTLGAEVSAKAGPYRVLFDARFAQGTDVFKGENLDGGDLIYGTFNPTEFNTPNRSLAFSLGLMVPF